MGIRRRTIGPKAPRILIVTPEITYLPEGMGNLANRLSAKAGGLADVSASLVAALFDLGADVHVALPHYRQMFHIDIGQLIQDELRLYQRKLPQDRIHLAEDRVFYYRDTVYSNYEAENPHLALIFQREVINNIISRVNPDLIHCNDWMTGLIPAHARRLGIPSLFTVHNIHTQWTTLEQIEEHGIDAAEFWAYLYYKKFPGTYEFARNRVPVDLLASGIFAAHFINTVSPTFLKEIADGQHDFIQPQIRRELTNKFLSNCASGILNAPDATYRPDLDPALEQSYGPADHVVGKAANKVQLQRRLGMTEDPKAPLLFWPSRLDPVQKGCQLLIDILYQTIHDYRGSGLQLAIISSGPHYGHFDRTIRMHRLQDRVALCGFEENLHHLGFGGADFVLMPSLFEPCGLPQMIGCLYGALPIVRDTGGLHDTVEHLDVSADSGNGFIFRDFDAAGLRWAIDEAMAFYRSPKQARERNIRRIMEESTERFSHKVTAEHYIRLYETMLQRPLVRQAEAGVV